MPQRILIVDDEPDILATLQEALRRFLPIQIVVDTATTGEEARDLLVDRPSYDMVISDERLPGLRGVELLEWLRLTHPATVRVLVTAYASGVMGEEAVNRAAAHLFFRKPLALESLIPALERALREKATRDAQESALRRALDRFLRMSRETA